MGVAEEQLRESPAGALKKRFPLTRRRTRRDERMRGHTASMSLWRPGPARPRS
jgi:hypothetical protein